MLFQILLQIGSARGPKTQDLVSTIVILAITLFVVLVIYITKPKLRPWMKPILFTTIMAVLIFVGTYMIVKKKENIELQEKVIEYDLRKN
ncbi:MAG: hypothetical protein U0V72_14310 [Cytophagales bacterium]